MLRASKPRRFSRQSTGGAGSGLPLLVAPWSGWLVFFYIAPLMLAAIVSTWSMEGQDLVPGFTLDNYANIFRSADGNLGLLIRTCLLALLVTFVVACVCFPVAYFIVFRMRSAGAVATTLTLITLPFLVGSLVRALAWQGVLGVQGLVNEGLQFLGIVDEPVGWLLFSRFAVAVSLAYNAYPFMLFALVLSLGTIDQRLVDAARDLGSGAFTAVVRVVLPLAAPGLLVGSVLAFVPAAGASIEPEIVGGSNGRFIANAITDRFLTAGDWPGAAALTVCFLIAVAVACGVLALLATLLRHGFGGIRRAA